MLDTHYIPNSEWGIRPILFTLFGIKFHSYPIFILLAILAAGIIYYFSTKKVNKDNENSFFIALGALIGGTVGAKIPSLITNYREILHSLPNLNPVLSGRTILGGLIGGTIGVIIVKKKLGITEKRGNLFAIPIIVGMIIGRIGCFLRGCCYGNETHLPWGTDFGDHIIRHPTQLYEIIFWVLLLAFILVYKNKFSKPGSLFKLVLASYFIFRFLLEFFKEEPSRINGLTIFQIAIPILLINLFRSDFVGQYKKLYNYNKDE